jgi:antagonist of KipI
MGYRMEGKKIESVSGTDIISDGIALGSVQVPADGRPIVLLADRQTTGGYAKIATVCSFDIPKLVQGRPGDRVRFVRISVEEAQKINRKRGI